jgi:hypothetical protein
MIPPLYVSLICCVPVPRSGAAVRRQLRAAMDVTAYGPDYFRCEKMACTLERRVCVARQETALSFDAWIAGRRDLGKKVAFAMCADCAQGKAIWQEEERMSEQQQKETPAPMPEPAPEAAAPASSPDSCKNCRRVMKIKAKGLCAGCYSVLVRCVSKGADPATIDEAMKAAALRYRQGPEAMRAYQADQVRKHQAQKMAAAAELKRSGSLTTDEFLAEVDEVAARHPDLPNGDAKPQAPPNDTAQLRCPAISILPPVIEVRFYQDQRDRDLWAFLRSEATRLRRTPDQQLLWILEAYMQSLIMGDYGAAGTEERQEVSA